MVIRRTIKYKGERDAALHVAKRLEEAEYHLNNAMLSVGLRPSATGSGRTEDLAGVLRDSVRDRADPINEMEHQLELAYPIEVLARQVSEGTLRAVLLAEKLVEAAEDVASKIEMLDDRSARRLDRVIFHAAGSIADDIRKLRKMKP